jgi:hypothetical protein
MFFMEFLYLTTDSLLAFKTAIITCFGYYILTFLKLMYKDARPFWLNNDITGYSCRFDFGDPSYHLYTLTTFWLYNIIMYKMKYAEKVNKQSVYMMFGGLIVFFCDIDDCGNSSRHSFLISRIHGSSIRWYFLGRCHEF